MFKIISSKEHKKLTRDVNYWKMRVLEEQEYWQKIHENKVSNIIKENKSLRRKIKELEKGNEHHCNRACFAEHVLPAIQHDLNNLRYDGGLKRIRFLKYWNEKITKGYVFISHLYVYNGFIIVVYK